jgi:zinc transport system substrate-binding protein
LKPSLAIAFLIPFALLGCKEDTSTSEIVDRDTGIYTTFYPTTYFAERIADGLVPVTCPLPEDEDPIFWRPPREVLASYQKADLVIVNGAGFEKWLGTASLAPGRVIDSGAPLSPDLLRYEDAVLHRHGPAGEHSHEGIDGHTWIDPINAKVHAAEILKALSTRWPEHSKKFASAAERLTADLDALDARLRELKPPLLLASHPAYNYIAKRYGWKIDNLDLDPSTMPSKAQLEEIRSRLASHKAPIILWEGQPSPEIENRLQSEFGLESILFSPCESLGAGQRAAGEDYLTIMNANIDRLAEAL